MKKYKSIAKAVLLSCTLALTTSCNDFLDKAPDDQLTMEMIFTDKIRTEDWLAGVYSSIPSPCGGISRHKVITLWAMISLFPKIGRRMDGAMCMPTPPKLESYLNMGPLLLGRITQAHTFRPYLLARGKSTSGKKT